MRSQSILGVMEKPAAQGLSPSAVQRRCLATNAHLILAASFAAMPVGLLWLMHGAPLAFATAMIGMAGGSLSLGFHKRADQERAALSQVVTLVLSGFVLAIADPAPIDSGLALMVLGPMLASLFSRGRAKRWSWSAFAVAGVAALGAGALGWSPLADAGATSLAGFAFVFGVGIVALAAHRLGASRQADQRAQANALRHLIEHVQDAVLRFGADGSLIFASRSSERLFGCPRYELANGGLFERVHVLDRPAFMSALAEARTACAQRIIEIRLRRDARPAEGDGSPAAAPCFIWVELSFSPIRDEEAGESSEVVALLRDVTDRHDRAREMEVAREAAEQASEAKSRFLATVGHELRTPLNAIVGFSEMMANNIGGELSPTHREYAGLIGKSGRHLIEIVSMLLDISRLEAGKFEIDAQPMNSAELLEPCLQMVRPLAEERRVTIETDLGRKLPEITADERACRQIVINLLSNAIKFSHEGGRITVAMKRQGVFLSIAVTDRGIGMDPSVMSRLGEAFFQAQDGLARRYEGTGLGLSIVKGLVDLHGGSLNAVSEAGLGTTMTVLLPINGPATKPRDNEVVTPLHRQADPEPANPWPDARRKAQ